MILMPQILDATANENTRYKRNELESYIMSSVRAQNFGLIQCKNYCSLNTKYWEKSHLGKNKNIIDTTVQVGKYLYI